MGKKLCIHGHFYQPPREDPWFGKIFLEPSAAPIRHWNARITRESYAPLAWARRLDAQGRIADLMNCYEWISFNVGPTLMIWLEREEPALLERILEADRLSLSRWGHGNAIAQVFHHIILPLASEHDKEIEIEWALADFRSRFGRESEGLWLSECAADIATLEVVAARGIKFVILSPHQAHLVRQGSKERAVNAFSLDYGSPYNVKLPSGNNIAAFFYEAGLSQSVAFEGLLSDGEKFWQKIRMVADSMPGAGDLLTVATDGETYGHHFIFGEMALAYVLSQAYSGRDGLELINFGAYLAAHPPTAEVVLHEPSSWSCMHGVERWRSDCGDSTGGHPGWHQKWRAPLREALDFVKGHVDDLYYSAGEDVFKEPRAALMEFGGVLVNHAAGPEFMKKHLKPGADEPKGWRLLIMQENALSAYASCAWFFDDLARIEPVNAMRFVLLALEFFEGAGGPDIMPKFEAILSKALSNVPEEGTGRDIFERRVLPSRQDPAKLCLFSYLHAFAMGRLPNRREATRLEYPNFVIRLSVDGYGEDGRCHGRTDIALPEDSEGIHYTWSGVLPHPASDDFVSFAEASIETRAKTPGQHGEKVWEAKGTGLARYLREFLDIVLMETSLAEKYEDNLTVARQLASTLRPYEEAQNGPNLPQLWSRYAAYIPLAVYMAPLSDEAIKQAGALLGNILSEYPGQQSARYFLENAVLRDLAEAKRSDADIAAGISRVNSVFKRTDWWQVQNALWRNGRVRPEYLKTAKALGFRA